MGAWVRAILPETSTPDVPEGLEDFLKDLEFSEPDNGTVLQQWGLDSFVRGSSHDYEDPQDSADFQKHNKEGFVNKETEHISTKGCARERFADESISCDSTLVLSSCFPIEDLESADITLVPRSQTDEIKTSSAHEDSTTNQSSCVAGVLANVCRTSPGTKNTDSGCYSGQGANSDSDSGCENSSGGRDALDPDGGYATLESSKHAAKQSSNVEGKVGKSGKNLESESSVLVTLSLCENNTANAVSDTSSAEVSAEFTISGSSCVPVSSGSEETSSFRGAATHPCSDSSTCSAALPLSTSSPRQPAIIPPRVPCQYSDDIIEDASFPTRTPAMLSSSNVPAHPSGQSDTNSTGSELPTFQAPGGEEYSLVLKRSERPSLESSQTSCRSSGRSSTITVTPTNSSASHHQSWGSPIENPETIEQVSQSTVLHSCKGFSEGSPNVGEEEDDSVFQSIMVVGSDSNNVKLFSECRDNAEIRAEIEHELTLSCNNNSESFYEPVGQGVSENNLSAVKTDKKSLDPSYSSDKPTKSLQGVDIGHCVKSCAQSSETEPLSLTPIEFLEIDACNKFYDNGKGDSTNGSNLEQRSHNNKETELNISIPASDSTEGPRPEFNLTAISPSADWVRSLLDKPDTTSLDLQQAMGRLKEKQGQIRRKRMAVHDKRQRVSSDGERLACEKEMAALEKLGQDTESDLRDLKNKLAVLQGESLDVLCGAANQPQGQGQGHSRRSKSGSRKRKQKRKS
ncbi:hypothetical protein ElyMa_005300700 [Elysia marginata]|uniref:BZIP domain-containing protein n=1 Tax=Elysia marginata TaxID=1093978 RepID=A0AAV4JYF0_9GAST|nr:hypothetical protein ElyMa_005300700 [Elysia marginata]